MTRAMAFLRSGRNTAGCCLASLGLMLLFAGVIDTGWPFIVGGLYLVGAVGWARLRPSRAEPASEEAAIVETLVQHMDALIADVSDRVTVPTLISLRKIQATLEGLLPRLRELEVSGALSIESSITVEETLRHYLPEMLSSYARLPIEFARKQPVHEGKTAEQILGEQLKLLEASLQQISREAYSGDTEALMNSGRFLQRRLRAKVNFQSQ